MGKRWFKVLVAIVATITPITMLNVTAFADANPQLVSVDNQNNRIFASSSQISRDGRYVLFSAQPEAPDYKARLYIRDRQNNMTSQVINVDSNGTLLDLDTGYSLTPYLAGSKVLFVGGSINDNALYEKDFISGALTTVWASGGSSSFVVSSSVSSDGNTVEWVIQDGQTFTLHIRNMTNNTEMTLPTHSYIASLSGDGRYLFYNRDSFDMSPLKLAKRDLQTSVEQDLDIPNAYIQVSDDGRYVAYQTFDGLIRQDTEGTNTWSFDYKGNGTCKQGFALSYDGSTLATSAVAAVPGGCTSSPYHLYVESDNDNGSSREISVNNYGNLYDYYAFVGVGGLNYDGSLITFYSMASNIGVLNPEGNLVYVKHTQSTPPFDTDSIRPTTSDVTLQSDTKQVADTDAVTMSATDDHTGIVTGEFFLQDNSQVQPSFTVIGFPESLRYGAGTPMTYANGILTGTIGADVPAGSYTVFARAQDGAGNWSDLATAQLTVVGATDVTPPALGAFSWTNNPKSLAQTSNLSVAVSDNLSGVAGGEYFIGDTDPGQNNGATMNSDGANLTTTFGIDFPTGVYKISVRAKDSAGNWSDPVSDYLVVYNPDGPRITGKRTIVPSLANGDVLPGLIAGSQTDKASFGFSVRYNNQNVINPNSDLQFKYSTGTHCNNPNRAQNCHELQLNATSIAWLTTQGVHDSTGIFQGTAELAVDGVHSQVVFRVTGVDGERLDSTSLDRFEIKIYSQESNPNTAAALYRVNSNAIARGNIKIL